MNARLLSLGSVVALIFVSGCALVKGPVEVPIDVRSRPVLDVSAFRRVLVAGFVAGGTQDIDVNGETVRLLRSALRTKTTLTVIDADARPLAETIDREPRRRPITSDEDLRGFESIFANAAYWRRVGDEYQQSIIVTGTMLFTVGTEAAVDSDDPSDIHIDRRQRGEIASFEEHRASPLQRARDRTVCRLRSRVIFIDGRDGSVLYSESFRERLSYEATEQVPALSSYFELMDRLVPRVLNTVSTQNLRTSRRLLQ